jgi:hypothetical protein
VHRVTFAIDAIGTNDPNAIELAIEIVGDLMMTLVSMNRRILRRYGSQIPLLYESGVVYEKLRRHVLCADDDDWQDIARTKKEKKGDCEDLVGYRVADLQHRQGVPGALPFILWQPMLKAGASFNDPGWWKFIEEHRYHILVRWPRGLRRYPKSVYEQQVNGQKILLEDPSRWLGMKVAA